MKAFALIVCLVMTAGVAAWTHPALLQQGPQQPPRFMAGVDLMRLELTVLDKRTRKPITGLTADDFIVKVAGKAQVIEAFDEVRVTASTAPRPRAFTEAARDVASNTLDHPRLFLLVMDDALHAGPFERTKGMDIAHAVVEGLGPDDMAAVVFAQDNRHAQDFTQDRVALRRAIQTYTPRPLDPRMARVMSAGVLERSSAFMRRMPGYRRAIVWITLGPGTVEVQDEELVTWSTEDGQPKSLNADPLGDIVSTGVRRVVSSGAMAPVPIYAYSTRGMPGYLAPFRPFGDEALQKVAVSTGGRVTDRTNAPEREVPTMFEELGSYYALAYRGEFPMDGKLRWLEVDVKGRDVIVVPSDTAFATPRTLEGARVVSSGVERPSGLLGALAGPLPHGEVRLTMAAVALAAHGSREQHLAVTLGMPAPAVGDARQQYGLTVLVYDGEGRKEIVTQQQTVAVPPRLNESETVAEVAIPLGLRPGRYIIRLAVQNVDTEASGSVYTTVVVPDFAREPLSLSGLAVGRAEGRPVGGREALSDILPFAPTTVRTFATTDRVGALLRVHQGVRTPIDAIVTSEIVNTADAVVAAATRTIAALQFQPGVGVDHPYELPLTRLTAGEYLLRVVVAAGKHTVRREVRFTVR